MKKPYVRQILYSLNVGNSARGREQVLTEVVVVSVGRKYFKCAKTDKWAHETTYYIDTWVEKNNCCANSMLYRSRKEYREEKEIREICRNINKTFEYGNNRNKLSIESLREINKILTDNLT
jgi:hypothetical protein